MSLASGHLDAFVAVARELSFSRAAGKLFVTQSALSQRIKGLEDELGLTLFIRNPSGPELTEVGERLLRYCQIKDQLESDFLAGIKAGGSHELAGVFRIAGFSSVMRSVVLPALTPLLRANSKIKFEFMTRETSQLPAMLTRSEADFIVMDYRWNRAQIQSHILGQEKYVVIESKKHKSPKDIYLDNDQNDRTTENFFRFQKGKAPTYKRAYMGDVYGILDGVRNGLGRAVMSRHLAEKDTGIRILKEYKTWPVDVVLHFHKQPFYPKLHLALLDALETQCHNWL